MWIVLDCNGVIVDLSISYFSNSTSHFESGWRPVFCWQFVPPPAAAPVVPNEKDLKWFEIWCHFEMYKSGFQLDVNSIRLHWGDIFNLWIYIICLPNFNLPFSLEPTAAPCWARTTQRTSEKRNTQTPKIKVKLRQKKTLRRGAILSPMALPRRGAERCTLP